MIHENEDKPDFVIITMRTPEEFTVEHIKAAVNIDFYSETFRDKLKGLARDKIYLAYCRTGERGEKAMGLFKELNFREVYPMLWGLEVWREDGLPVTAPGQ